MLRISVFAALVAFSSASLAQEPAQALAGHAPAVSCYTRICAVVRSDGASFYLDLNTNSVSPQGNIEGGKGPFSVACENSEYCVAIDTTGQTWVGALRPPRSWSKGAKIPVVAPAPIPEQPKSFHYEVKVDKGTPPNDPGNASLLAVEQEIPAWDAISSMSMGTFRDGQRVYNIGFRTLGIRREKDKLYLKFQLIDDKRSVKNHAYTVSADINFGRR